ncbi:uncharacterized protein LACBIDRAFT_327130 [Laccaria bicolor S238N-H82]|uniref:Predicted protein n=1 Tax=Laccaria bicolor (strain S238N-H82 / ATCC MYA-4686) TaxID=486041 RepID=B0DB96_LACBS|nr:uncharacterized protein LACBIDRAFT_327130 [Laccaria bicolor S238N-H82]EDR07950.1 predicted protein [Laccaria bicolor S238N-H82]|eukprot:XP_001881020.1 predicted protein [Laccaria bicolor S238N-H82]
MEVDQTKQCFDGHLGCFDPMKSPQHYDPRQPCMSLSGPPGVMNLITQEGREAVSEDWLSEVPFAVDNMLGAWINGAKEDKVYWLLKHRIPCFIIHEISTSNLCFYREEHKNLDFIVSMDAQYLALEHNGFDHVAHKWKAEINAVAGQEGMPPAMPLVLLTDDRARSNPLSQGWNGTKHRLLEETPEVVMKQLTCPVKDSIIQPPPKATFTAHIPEPEVRVLAQDRVEWLVPPGKWSFWKEEDLDKNTSCFCPVTSQPDDSKSGTIGQRAVTPPLESLPLRSTLLVHQHQPRTPISKPALSSSAKPLTPLPAIKSNSLSLQKLIPTKPRAHRQSMEHSMQAPRGRESSLGRHPWAFTLEGRDSPSVGGSGLPKKLRSMEQLTERVLGALSMSLSTPSVPPLPELEDPSPQTSIPTDSQPIGTMNGEMDVDTIVDSESDSCFLCFEGLPFEWEECQSWFYGKAVFCHIVWINQMYWTVTNSHPLVWLDLKSNEDTCTLRGFLTHRRSTNRAVIISHFISKSTFQEATRNYTDKWECPTAPLPPPSDDFMEGPAQTAPLEMQLTSPRPTSPMPDVTLLHRAGVTLEERVEGAAQQRRRAGKKHRKLNAQHQSNV